MTAPRLCSAFGVAALMDARQIARAASAREMPVGFPGDGARAIGPQRRPTDMIQDLRLQDLLDEINAYIDNMPSMGSSEYLRFTEALGELLAHSQATAELKLTPERDIVGREIDRVFERIDREKNVHRRGLGSSSAHAASAPNRR